MCFVSPGGHPSQPLVGCASLTEGLPSALAPPRLPENISWSQETRVSVHTHVVSFKVTVSKNVAMTLRTYRIENESRSFKSH